METVHSMTILIVRARSLLSTRSLSLIPFPPTNHAQTHAPALHGHAAVPIRLWLIVREFQLLGACHYPRQSGSHGCDVKRDGERAPRVGSRL